MKAEKILIVDDLATNRKLLSRMLVKMADYTVVEAVNGREAVALFKDENPDLILMDINMPEMSGLEATTKIKAIAGDTYIPIIFLTALSAESALSDSLASGGDDFISKPFELDILKSKINAHLRIRELNLQLSSKNNELNDLNNNLVHEQELIEYFFKNALEQNFLDKKLINYHMSSMSAFNGDIFLAGRSPKGCLYIVLGDFTGHGLTAAMGTLPAAMIFFKMVAGNAAIADIARELNRQLHKLMPTSMFFAATLLELNAQGNILTTWMGGMPECYLLDAKGDLKGLVESRHMPLGILNDSGFDSRVEIHNVEENDKLYLYSDGIIEADKQNGEMFGSERLKNVLVSNGENRISKVLEAIKEFGGSTEQNDDITIVELSCIEVPVVENEESDPDENKGVLPWTMSISLSADDMRNTTLITELSQLLGSLPALHKHKDVIEVLLSEIYYNALDYSILGLDGIEKNNEDQFEEYYKIRDEHLKNLHDACITFDFSYISALGDETLIIRIKDNGKGYQGHDAELSETKLSGRGLDIVNNLCKSVEFSDDGKQLELVFQL
ncbi:MAG: SpoIIE family protein phosphatase [Sulfuriflexus sp.]|nr:SpoIIE family protein phosphatase [Sulfuriflexus sp.]